MTHYLAIQNTYTNLQLALYTDSQQRAFKELDKTKASKECLSALQELLNQCNIHFNDLAFIAANQGPGPFTTLRVAIATINGLSFARKIPLIVINAIEAFLQEYKDEPAKNKVVLLNAFGHDVYYGIHIDDTYEDIGCGNYDSILLQIAQKIPDQKILFLGNGVELCHSQIQAHFEERAIFLNPNPQTVSLAQIAIMGYQKWHDQKDLSYQLQPFYFKQAYTS